MIRSSKLFAVLALLSSVLLASCEDSFPGQPYAVPVDTLAGRNGNILYAKIYPFEFPPRAEVLSVDPNAGGPGSLIDADGFILSKPGNDRIAFIKILDILGNMELYTISHAGFDKSIIKTDVDTKTHWLVPGSAAISPDGKKVAYGVEEISTGQTSLWMIVSDNGTSGPRPVKIADNFAQSTVPFFSPDGNLLAYFTQEYDAFGAIIGQDGFAIANVEATPIPDQLYQGDFTLQGDETIEWSPDGSNVMFGVGTELYTYTIANGDQDLTANATHGAYSPDGAKIVYTDVSLGYQLVIRELASGRTTQLTSDPNVLTYYPQWSPDGKWILFSSLPQASTGQDLAEIKILEINNPQNIRTIGNQALRGFWLRQMNH